MSVKKMFLIASMALAAIAVAAPVAAQANVQLTANGVPLKDKAPVTATSKNLVTTVGTSGVTLECAEVVLHYTVATKGNGPTHVTLNPTVAHNATTVGCVTNVPGVGKFPNTISNAGAGLLTINTWGTGSAAATFTTNTPALGRHCTYTGNIPVQATNGTNTLHVETPNSLHPHEESCETGEMHGFFHVTSAGVPVIANITATP